MDVWAVDEELHEEMQHFSEDDQPEQEETTPKDDD